MSGLTRDEKELEAQLQLLDQYQSVCTRCGLCSEGCLTFQASQWEQESPRGRIQLAQDFLEGRISPQSKALETFSRCLGCHACEVLCPLGVRYSQIRLIVQDLRRQLDPHRISPLSNRVYRQWIKTAYRMGALWPRYFSFLRRSSKPKFGELTLVVGCIQERCHPYVIEAARKCLRSLGYQVHVAKNQPCCGAILDCVIQGGEETLSYAQDYHRAVDGQKHRMQQFLDWLPPSAYALSLGCLHHINADRQPVVGDLYQFILEAIHLKSRKLCLPKLQTVYYQPFCRQHKGDGDPILNLLNQIENLNVLVASYACCGGAGGRSVCDPEHSKQWADRQTREVPEGACLIVASPECYEQFRLSQKKLKLSYAIEWIAEALLP